MSMSMVMAMSGTAIMTNAIVIIMPQNLTPL